MSSNLGRYVVPGPMAPAVARSVCDALVTARGAQVAQTEVSFFEYLEKIVLYCSKKNTN